jgi:hypothetical protein
MWKVVPTHLELMGLAVGLVVHQLFAFTVGRRRARLVQGHHGLRVEWEVGGPTLASQRTVRPSTPSTAIPALARLESELESRSTCTHLITPASSCFVKNSLS